MKLKRLRFLKGSFALSIIVSSFLFIPFNAHAAISTWHRGASIAPKSTNDFASDAMKSSLRQLKADGANYVSFVIPYYQSDAYATEIHRGYNTPTDDALVAAISYAHSIGLKVALNIHDDCDNGEWRANINPSDRNAWFGAYGTILQHYGELGKLYNVEEIVIGTEMINMASDSVNPTNTQNWGTMIDNLRGVYDGKLSYGSNWGDGGWTDETPQIKFWDKLDYVGMSAYYWLASQDNSVESMSAAWDRWEPKIHGLSQQWNKPVEFTEVGYRSMNNAHSHPWDWWSNDGYNEDEQANAYAALFSYWNSKDYLSNVFLWDWKINPPAANSGDTDFTPQNKKAEQVMQEWFINPPTNNPPATTSFVFSGSDVQTKNGQSTPVNVSVTNKSSQAMDVLVDLEIYDSSGQKAHQEFFGSQHFAANETKQFTTNWTPSSEGTFKLAGGIFKNDWSQNYAWKSSISMITVSANDNPPPPPTQTGNVKIWWPSDGVTMQGTQPFKAMLSNNDVSNYTMYWSVDSGQLNLMDNSDTDYPHKESLVDVSTWNWRGSGPYNISFTAKDNAGAILGTNSINIHTAQ